MNDRKKAFDELSKQAQDFIKNYGNPHCTIIITQNGIEILQSEMCEPFTLND